MRGPAPRPHDGRRRIRGGCWVALSVLLPPVGWAAEGPRLIPTRDVAVTYRTVERGTVLEQRIRFSVAARRLRIDPPTPGMFVIVDYAAHRMDVVREPDRSVVEMDAPFPMPGLGVTASSGPYTRIGDDVIAGTPCAEWAADGEGGAHICVTADGILLRVRVGARDLATAASVRYGPQDAAAFRVPEGYTRVAPPR